MNHIYVDVGICEAFNNDYSSQAIRQASPRRSGKINTSRTVYVQVNATAWHLLQVVCGRRLRVCLLGQTHKRVESYQLVSKEHEASIDDAKKTFVQRAAGSWDRNSHARCARVSFSLCHKHRKFATRART